MARSRTRNARRPARQGRESADQFGVQSVEIGAAILKSLAACGRAVALKELAAAAGMSRAKAHRYLVSLRRAGLVAQDPQTSAYRIGPVAVTVGLVGLRSLSPLRHLQDALPALRDKVDETVTLAVWGSAGPTVVAMEESSHVVTMNVRVGSVLPVAGTAIGRVFAAYLPAATTRPFIDAERRSQDRRQAVSAKAFAAQLADIRRRRLARAHAPLLPGVDALAAPVFGQAGTLVAVLCVVGRAATMDGSWDGELARTLAKTAHTLSRDLGYAEPA